MFYEGLILTCVSKAVHIALDTAIACIMNFIIGNWLASYIQRISEDMKNCCQVKPCMNNSFFTAMDSRHFLPGNGS